MPLTSKLKESADQISSGLIVFFVAIAFSLIPANFVTIIIKERINNTKHLMRVSGINIIAYWIVNFIFEILKYYFTAGICILIIYLFDLYRDYFYVLYILYGPAMVAATYCLSFCFSDEYSGQNFSILINYLVGALGATVCLMFREQESLAKYGKILAHFFAIIPSFNFNYGYNMLLSKVLLYIIDYPDTWVYMINDDKVLVEKWNLLVLPIVYLSSEILIYIIILIIIEWRSYTYIKPSDHLLNSQVSDRNVINEIEKANKEDEVIITDEYGNNNKGKKSNDFTYSVRIKNLKKSFYISDGCLCFTKEIEAIKNLNFCIKPGECFGLLGLNGSGKTTTFKCITQEHSPSNGCVYINGKDISNSFSELSHLFGYCPQFDAIFEYMTVYENLEFYAKIKGVKLELLDKIVTAMLTEMSLDEFPNKLAGQLSGGNKRKLSVAIAMLCNPQIVLLDEPSTGMDPEARRFMWSVIHKISTKGQKSSVIMTTHSMDEAETLCKRMAIMVNGEFVCLGSSDEIKEHYGYGFELDVRIKPLNEDLFAKIIEESQLDFKLKITNENIKDVLTKLNKQNFIDELSNDRLGSKLIRDINLNGSVSLHSLVSWCFFVENAFKFMQKGHKYFDEVILTEYIDNNFLFKLKKGPKTKSIGFFFGLYEKIKDLCYVTEYSIQQTSLEQIFNKFAAMQKKCQGSDGEEAIDNKDIEKKNEIVVNEELYSRLLVLK